MGFFLNAMTVISICTRFANGTILVNVKHLHRVIAVSVLAISAFCLIAFASFMQDHGPGYFWVAVAASCLTGIATGMGEATFLGFLKGFPSHTVGYVSSGTGFAGISGTSTLLILQGLDFSNQAIFLVAAPTILVYFASFYWLT